MTATDAATSTSRRPRLHGVDGLRALAALWVVMFHIRAFSGGRISGVPGLDLFVRSGSTGVSLFLVLSGFCLFVPYAGGRSQRFAARRFFSRRGRRLLPAYYASLLLIVIAVVVANGHLGLEHHSAVGLTGQVAAHATLTQQLFPSAFYALDGAYWSLGLEWELYLTLPLLLVGIRRVGLAKTVLAVTLANIAYRLVLAAAIGQGLVAGHSLLATAVLPNLFIGRWAEFALGMVAAELYVTERVAQLARRLSYLLVLVIPVAFLTVGNPLSHLLFGAVFFVLLCVVLADNNIVARAVSWPPLVLLGLMSYSIYLVHQPLIQTGADLLRGPGASPDRIFLELLVLVPVVLLCAWAMFVTVERRTLTTGSLDYVPGQELLLLPGRDLQDPQDPHSEPHAPRPVATAT